MPPFTTTLRRRLLRLVTIVAATAVLTSGVAPAQAADLPPGPSAPAPAPSPIDAYPPYEGQSTCDPTDKPGATYALDMVLAYYKVGRRSGISRACSNGGQSEHKEGRALDWGLSVNTPAEKAAGDQFTTWLTAEGPDGKPGYNARRLGVMYVIWNTQIWSSGNVSAGWHAYTGAVPHTDHVHVSLSWNGAYRRSSWWTGTAIPGEATTKRYVTMVYRDLFNRDPDPAGLAGWTTALTSGTPRVAVANGITYSAEYRSGLITGAYDEFLGRGPDAAGLAGWLNAMTGGMTIQAMEVGFLASPEYYAQSGGTDAGWVRRLYQHVLARQASDGEVQAWVDALAAGGSRQQVATGFVVSTERLTTVVDGYYQKLLGRSLDPLGQVVWVRGIQTGLRTEAVIGGIVSSAEYYAKAENFRG
jgi:hypothetical protein